MSLNPNSISQFGEIRKKITTFWLKKGALSGVLVYMVPVEFISFMSSKGPLSDSVALLASLDLY